MTHPSQSTGHTEDSAAAPARQRPWQVTVAVTLIAVWWVGSYAALIALDPDDLGGGDVFPLVGVGFWTLIAFLLLRNIWRGGGATEIVAKLAITFGTVCEISGTLMSLLWLFDSSAIPLWTSLMIMLHAGLPIYGGRLLLSPAARAYRAGQRGTT